MEPLELVAKKETSITEQTLSGIKTTYRKLNELSLDVSSLRKELAEKSAISYVGVLTSEQTDKLYEFFHDAFKEGMEELAPTGKISFVNKNGIKTETEYKSFEDYIRAFYPSYQKRGMYFEFFMEQDKNYDWIIICQLNHRESRQFIRTWASAKKPNDGGFKWNSEEADITKAKKRALRNLLGI